MHEQINNSSWQNRIVKNGEMSADQFLAHPMNARRHPGSQRDALRGSLNAVGWIAPVIVSARSGFMLDGHARVEEALSKNDAQLIPFVEVDVTEDEERLILATFDPITGLASYNRESLETLLSSINTYDDALQLLMNDLATSIGLVEINNPDNVWQAMPEFENENAVFRSIIVHFDKQEDVDHFAKLVNQTLTDKTKYIWYPFKKRMALQEFRVIDSSNEP